MPCPLCQAPLEDFAIGPVVVDRCTACHALWLEREAFAEARRGFTPLIPEGWGMPARATDHSNPPRCSRNEGARLQPYRWFSVNFWRCPDCKGAMLRAADFETLAEAGKAAREASGTDTVIRLLLQVIG